MASVTSAALSLSGAGLGSVEDERRALDLTARAAAGDLVATQEFLALVSATVLRVVAGALGAAHPDLDDAVQQSLIALLRALPAFRGECHPLGYASRIAFRTALRARRRSKLDASRRQLLAVQALEETPTPSQDPAEDRRRRLVRELLEELPEEQAETFVLRVVLGWSLDEIARATSVPLNTVRSRVRLAKEALRRRIEGTPELVAELKGEP